MSLSKPLNAACIDYLSPTATMHTASLNTGVGLTIPINLTIQTAAPSVRYHGWINYGIYFYPAFNFNIAIKTTGKSNWLIPIYLIIIVFVLAGSQNIDGVNVDEDVVLPARDTDGERQLRRRNKAAAGAAQPAPLRAAAGGRRLTPSALLPDAHMKAIHHSSIDIAGSTACPS